MLEAVRLKKEKASRRKQKKRDEERARDKSHKKDRRSQSISNDKEKRGKPDERRGVEAEKEEASRPGWRRFWST